MKFHFLDEVYVVSGFYKGAIGYIKDVNKDTYIVEDNRTGQDIKIKEGALIDYYKSEPYLKEKERELKCKKEIEDYDNLPRYKKILAKDIYQKRYRDHTSGRF